MERDKVLEKIKKCMNLSKSSNANEAMIALKQMRKLMNEYNINMIDVQISLVKEAKLKIGSRLSKWKQELAVIVAKAFDCKFCWGGNEKTIDFVGFGSNAEIALYAYETLLAQLDADRKKYMKNNHIGKTTKERNQISLTYCRAWLSQIHKAVENIVPKEEEKIIIKQYMANVLNTQQSKYKGSESVRGEMGEAIYKQGMEDGSKANLFHATGVGESQKLIGESSEKEDQKLIEESENNVPN